MLVRKGVCIKTTMFCEYDNLITMPHLTKERLRTGRVNDQLEEVPNYYFHYIITDSVVPA